jgi:hypothetical protein
MMLAALLLFYGLVLAGIVALRRWAVADRMESSGEPTGRSRRFSDTDGTPPSASNGPTTRAPWWLGRALRLD